MQKLYPRLILASKSPRRKLLLQQLGIAFDTIDSNVSEKPDGQLRPSMVAQSLAKRKAKSPAIPRDGVVIGADTLILVNGLIFGKPTNAKNARKILEQLRGRYHHVITGIAIIDYTTKKTIYTSVSTLIEMKNYPDSSITNYITSGEPNDKAGAYAIQGIGKDLVKTIKGCYNNVVGLPLCEISYQLIQLGLPLSTESSFCKLPSGQLCPYHKRIN